MERQRLVSALLAVLLLLGPGCAFSGAFPQEEGKLERIRGSVRERNEPENPSGREPRPAPLSEEDEWFWGHLAGIVFLSPVWLPILALGDDYDQGGFFPEFPYAGSDNHGALGIGRREWRVWSGRAAMEAGYDFNDEIGRTRLSVLLETTSRLGIQASLDYLDEELGLDTSDDLGLWDVNGVFRFAQSENAQFRAGLGARFLTDNHGTDGGINFTYGADFFPAQPLVLSLQADYGTLGSSGAVHHRATLGVLLDRFEIYAGFDHLNIGGNAIYGPLAGLRLWF